MTNRAKINFNDVFALIFGVFCLGLFIIVPDNPCLFWLSFVPGLLGLHYIGRALYLFFHNRVKFDWLLINGNFLKKVCCIVILTPFVIMMTINTYNLCSAVINGSGIAEVVANESCESYVLKQQHLMDSTDMFQKDEYNEYDSHMGVRKPSLFWTVYYHFIDPGNQHMATSSHGRPWAALIGILGVFLLNGLLVSSIIGYIDRRKEMWHDGELRYPRFLRGNEHYVIIGGNDMVAGIINQLFKESPDAYILIQTSQDVGVFRKSLFSSINDERWQQHIIIYYGERASETELNFNCQCNTGESQS